MILQIDFEESESVLNVDFGEIQQIGTPVPAYDGPYVVTPTMEGSSLATEGKKMEADVTIHPIPFFNVSNTAGGSTVYIANQI